MRSFRNLNIWKDSITIVTKVYHLAELLPLEEKYGLRSQISRAAISRHERVKPNKRIFVWEGFIWVAFCHCVYVKQRDDVFFP